jgi:hypothetical protein
MRIDPVVCQKLLYDIRSCCTTSEDAVRHQKVHIYCQKLLYAIRRCCTQSEGTYVLSEVVVRHQKMLYAIRRCYATSEVVVVRHKSIYRVNTPLWNAIESKKLRVGFQNVTAL